MKGRDLLFQAMRQQGIEYLFGNPGTTELPVIDGCTEHPEVRYVLCLHEGVAVGMAAGYARATGRVGVANVHVAPGLANGLSNLYNAWRAGIPMLVTGGQHHTHLTVQEPMLTADLAEMARPFTKWAYEPRHVEELPVVLHRAFKEAATPPTGPVYLSLPADVMLAETEAEMPPITRVGAHLAGDDAELSRSADLLVGAHHPMIVAGDGVGASDAWPELVELSERLGAPVHTENLASFANFPNRHPHWAGALPGVPAGMRSAFSGVDVALLCGFTSQAPLAFYDGAGSLIPPSVRLLYLHDNPWEIGKNHPGAAAVLGHVKTSLAALNALVAARGPEPGVVAERSRSLRERAEQRQTLLDGQVKEARGRTTIAPLQVAAELADLLPKGAVIANEAVSNSGPFQQLVPFAEPICHWHGKGGGLGHSGPAALGLKMGAPERAVVNVTGDGSFLYHPQTLWTAASLRIPVLFLIINNGGYRVLHQLMKGMGGPWGPPGTYPPGLEIQGPAVGFVDLARSFGVEAERVTSPDQVRPALVRGLSADRPYLVDVVVD